MPRHDTRQQHARQDEGALRAQQQDLQHDGDRETGGKLGDDGRVANPSRLSKAGLWPVITATAPMTITQPVAAMKPPITG